MMFPKRGRVKLSRDEYCTLCKQVYARDGWRCRRCGDRTTLQAHHLVKRSAVRLDILENLVTLCAACHEAVERHQIDILGVNANEHLTFVPRS